MMRKNDCPVVRDLMPLVIDRVASDESRELVENHVSGCESCKKQYDAMKADLPAEARTDYEAEQSRFVDALRSIKKKRLKRRLLAVALVVLVGAAAAFGAVYAYFQLYQTYSVAVDNGLYSLSLARLSDGRVVVTADVGSVPMNYATFGEEHKEDDGYIVYVGLRTTPIHQEGLGHARDMSKMAIFVTDADPSITGIRQGRPDDCVTVWTQGEPIPAASDEMEAYFALDAHWEAWWESRPVTDDGKLVTDTGDDYAWYERLDEARQAVPEWQ